MGILHISLPNQNITYDLQIGEKSDPYAKDCNNKKEVSYQKIKYLNILKL